MDKRIGACFTFCLHVVTASNGMESHLAVAISVGITRYAYDVGAPVTVNTGQIASPFGRLRVDVF
jgi:hypothetical protein